MGRPKTQTDRRLKLVAAAESMIAKRGLAGVTLRDVANEAGMSSSALLYYYPGLKDLLDDVQCKAVERFCTLRAASVAAIADPRARLKAMIESGLPVDKDDQLCRLLLELGAYSRSDASYAARHITLFERQVAIYVGILEAGAATGIFKLQSGSDTIARSLVVLEDGLGLHLTNIVPAVDHQAALTILTHYAELATGCHLG
ncbi:TetR/AcrR family transcriptional regulator [Mesorhizobium cantuariense]|uniref:TetR/AcrR family transcriptional regulator n=1 Tax=Mesorhizobium cantuariense TaxID=1300275 RepID=A0ABV7MNZ2_9HYPH